jgi:hypothetical protein
MEKRGMVLYWVVSLISKRMNYYYNCFSFDGKISDFKIWNVALSQEQVLEKMWEYSVKDKCLMGCWWFIDEKDLSENKNDLKFRTLKK